MIKQYSIELEIELYTEDHCDGCNFCDNEFWQCNAFKPPRLAEQKELKGSQERPEWCPLKEKKEENK
jgi:hypothetical protein